MLKPKNKTIAILLASLSGILGVLGVGHLYVGRIRRGIILLISGWAIIGTSFLFLSFYFMSGLVIPPPGYPRVQPPESALAFIVAVIILFHGFVALWIWQIIDARSVCEKYNNQIGN